MTDEYDNMPIDDLDALAEELGVNIPKPEAPSPDGDTCIDCGKSEKEGKRFSIDGRNKRCIGRGGCTKKFKDLMAQRSVDAHPAGTTLREVCIEYAEDLNVRCRNLKDVPGGLGRRTDSLKARGNLVRRAPFYYKELRELERLEDFKKRTGLDPSILPSIAHFIGLPDAERGGMTHLKALKDQYRHETKPDSDSPGWVHRIAWLRWKLDDVPQVFIDKCIEEAKERREIVTDKVRYTESRLNEQTNFDAAVNERVRFQQLNAEAGDTPTVLEYVEHKTWECIILDKTPGDEGDVALDAVNDMDSVVAGLQREYDFAGFNTERPAAAKKRAKKNLDEGEMEQLYRRQEFEEGLRGHFYVEAQRKIEAGTMGTRRDEFPNKYSHEALRKLTERRRIDTKENLDARPNGTVWYRIPSEVMSDLDAYLESGEIPNDFNASQAYPGQHDFTNG